MTAREMFEELGYEQISASDLKIRYFQSFEVGTFKITFSNMCNEVFFETHGNFIASITPKELKAINKQVEELGWLEDEGH